MEVRFHPKKKKKGFIEVVSKLTNTKPTYWHKFKKFLNSSLCFVGGFDNEVDAARAYDLAALKLWGKTAPINFPVCISSKDRT